MAGSPKKYCWDACAWIAYIQKERIEKGDGQIEDRYSLCRSIIGLAEKGNAEIFISGLCLVEVCKQPVVSGNVEDQIIDFFENDYIVVVPVDTYAGGVARHLMFGKHTGLKPPDATHLAAGLVASVDEFHTFDDKLLDLDGQLTKTDGTVLKICKPGLGGPAAPLLDTPERTAQEANDANPDQGEGGADGPSEEA